MAARMTLRAPSAVSDGAARPRSCKSMTIASLSLSLAPRTRKQRMLRATGGITSKLGTPAQTLLQMLGRTAAPFHGRGVMRGTGLALEEVTHHPDTQEPRWHRRAELARHRRASTASG